MRSGTVSTGIGRLVDLAIARPRATLALVALVVVLAGLGALRLEIRTDGRALVPREDPAVRFDDTVRRHFGLRDPIVVVLDSGVPDGLFQPATLGRLVAITDALRSLDGVEPEQVTSLVTEVGPRVYPNSTLDFRPLVDPPFDSPADLRRIRGDLGLLVAVDGTLVSRDRRATAVLVGVPLAAAGDGLDRRALVRRVTAAVEPLAGSDHVSIVGAPVAEALLGDHLVADLAVLLPASLAIIAVVLWVGCRRPWGVLLGMLEVGAAQIVTFGLMGWVGSPVYLTTAVLPVILVTLGLADEIHVFWRHQQVLADGTLGAAAVRRTLDDMARPLLATTATTSVGFLSFLASPLDAVRSFGVFAAIGIVFCLLFSFTAIPAALVLLGDARSRRPPRVGRAETRRFDRLAATVGRRPRAVLALLAVLTLGLVAGTAKLDVQDSWLDGFAPSSPFRQAVEATHERFFGTHLLRLHLAFDPLAEPPLVVHGVPGPLVLAERLEQIERFEELLRSLDGVGGVLGAATQFLDVAAMRHGLDRRRVPDEPLEVAELWDWFDRVRGEHRRRAWVDDAREQAMVTVFLRDANFRDTAALLDAIRAYAAEHLEPTGVRLGVAGDVAVSQAMIPAIVRTQVSSVLLALVGAWLVVSLGHRSWRVGLVVVAPAAVAVAWVFGLMGWAGVPLGVATSMFCAITLGVGVDHAIHVHHAFARARGPTPDRIRQAFAFAGPAVVADTLAVATGFGLLVVSSVPANARLGLLAAAAVVASCGLALGGLGAWWGCRERGPSRR